MCKYSCNPGFDGLSQLKQKKKNLSAVCIQPSPLRRHLENFKSYGHSQNKILERVFEAGIYNVSKGNVFFLVSLNVRCHDVTKHV